MSFLPASRFLALSLGIVLFATLAGAATKVTRQPFGKTSDGTPVEVFTLSDGAHEARIDRKSVV